MPIWTLESLRSHLSVSPKTFSNLICYLTDKCLVKHASSLRGSYILPLYCLEESPSRERLESVWPSIWYGHEIVTTIRFYAPVPAGLLRQIMTKWLSLEKTLMAWRTGLVNREAGCFVLVRLEGEKRLIVAVRILNPECQFNVATKGYLLYSHFVFMEYLMDIKLIIASLSMPIDVSGLFYKLNSW